MAALGTKPSTHEPSGGKSSRQEADSWPALGREELTATLYSGASWWRMEEVKASELTDTQTL